MKKYQYKYQHRQQKPYTKSFNNIIHLKLCNTDETFKFLMLVQLV